MTCAGGACGRKSARSSPLDDSSLRMSTAAQRLSAPARRYVILMTLLGLGVLGFAGANWESPDLLKLGSLLMVGVFSSGIAITVPGAAAGLPLAFIFVLLGVIDFTWPEAVALASLVALAQCFAGDSRRPGWRQICFGVSTAAVATGVT